MARPGFMIHFDTVRPALRLLDDGQKGVFFQAMVDYAQFGQEPAFEGAMAGAWEFPHDSLDKDNTRYAEIVEKRAQAGKLGGQANASKCWKVKQMKATQANPSKPSQLQPQIKTYPHSSPEGRYGPQVGGTEGLTASGRPTPGR